MKKLLIVLIFLIYFLTSIVYIDIYEFKNVRNMLWKNNDVSVIYMGRIKNINTPKELVDILDNIATKYNVDISKIVYKKKTKNGKRKIKVYTTCNNKTFDNVKIYTGRALKNNDLPSCYISSEQTNSKEQLGKVSFFSLSSNLNIYNLSGILYNGESIGGGWFVGEKDVSKLSLITKDLKHRLNCEYVEICTGSSIIDDFQSNEYYKLRYYMIGVLIVLYVITFLTMMYWLFSRYKELAVRKMFGTSNKGIKVKVMLKELVVIHIEGLIAAGIVIFGFLIAKLGFGNIGLFLKNWLIFNIVLTVISLVLMFIPLNLVKYIKIPLMLKNKKTVKVIKRVNYITKCVVGVAVITAITNSVNNLHWLYLKTIENKVWNNSLNYSLVKTYATLPGTIHGVDGEKEVEDLYISMKKWFKVCNEKGAIYINARNYVVGADEYEKQMQLRYGYSKDEMKEIMGKSIKVNNNYLQINPIYDVKGKQINIPDHNEHTLNLLVPERLKKYDKQVREKYSEEFYSNKWKDYKLNIIYIKDNQKCFTYQTNIATETQNYVIGSIIQVVSNNNMHLDSYGCCCCNGFYPKISNIENPYQDLLPDIKLCGVEKKLLTADVLYEVAAKNVYETEQQFFQTVEYTIFVVMLLLMLIISTCVNYLEEYRVWNAVKRLHGIGFGRRYANFIKSMMLIWTISICFMLVINYNGELVDKIIMLFYLPNNIVLVDKLTPGGYFSMEYINWYLVAGVILTDIIISMTILKIYENKKISSVLKGE